MSRRKCFFGCEGRLNLFAFPAEESVRAQWTQLLFPEQRHRRTNVFVCSRHFPEDSFLNRAQYEAGFAARLVLKDGAVPDVKSEPEEDDSSSKHTVQPQLFTPQRRHMGCQTERRPTASVATQFCHLMVSVGTQLSYSPTSKPAATQLSCGTLRQHVRSKATQVTDSTQQDAWTPAEAPATSPSPDTEPAKRARLELVKKEEEEEMICGILELHDSMYDPNEPSETRGTEAVSSDLQYTVSGRCLRELFQTCPVCRQDCEVHQQSLETSLCFSQRCSSCQYSRTWQSQPT